MKRILSAIPALALAAWGIGLVGSAGASNTITPVTVSAHPMALANVPAGLPHTHLPERLLTNSANGSAVSNNWAGYAAVACSTCHLRYAETQFTVPSVSCPNSTIGTSGYAFASHWVGLDGFNNDTVEQTGVSGYCTSTSSPASYYAWYEMYPLDPVTFSGVSPGDAITASVFYTGSAYSINLTNTTTRGYIQTTQACPSGSSCKHTNAEVISEDPGGAVPYGYDLANFGRSNYRNSQVTTKSGVHGNYASTGYWTAYSVTMKNGSDLMAYPGSLKGGAAFPIVYHAGQ